MIYVLLGKTCSGKTTLLAQLVELGYKTIVTYTTRPKRPNEVDGKDYFFISKQQYDHLEEFNLLVAPNTFTNAYGTKWSYGINVHDLNFDEDYVVITEPKGYRDLVQKLGEQNVCGVYLNTSYEIRLLRGLNRNDHAAELLRRLDADELDFMGFGNEVEHIVAGLEKQEILEEVLKILGGTLNENA
jgi:guanylate kinase